MYEERTHEFFKKIPFNFNDIDSKIFDLVEIMSHIYFTDIFTKRLKKNKLETSIPVINLTFWNKKKFEIEKLLKWVSEEQFIITFFQRQDNASNQYNCLPLQSFNKTSLFSGGLDSLAGAFYNYNLDSDDDYLGFVNKNEEGTNQRKIAAFYRKVFKSTNEIIILDKPSGKKEYYIQSTRSLLYLALAIFKSHVNGSNEVKLFENGVLSLNPELSNRYTTKTTHPKTIYMFNKLLYDINENLIIKTPFVFKTKGEILNTMDLNFKSQIKDTFTCGQGRTHPERTHKGQCGVCIPCLLRKISLSAFDNEAFDSKYQYDYNCKLKDIPDDNYRKDYEANYAYFKEYSHKIMDRTIFHEIEMRTKYYPFAQEYFTNTDNMLIKFAKEFERFEQKYAPYWYACSLRLLWPST